MPELKVRITTVGELAGAKAVEAQLERQIGQAKALGKEYAGLEERLKVVRKATTEYTDSQTQLSSGLSKGAQEMIAKGRAAGKLTASLGGVWSLMRQITFLLPGLGMAGLIAGIGSVTAWLARMLINANRATEGLEEFKRHTDLVAEAMAEGQGKADDFSITLGQIAADTVTMDQALTHYIEKLKEYFEMMGQVSDKGEELQLAEADLITDPKEREAKKKEIRARHFADRENQFVVQKSLEQSARDRATVGGFDQATARAGSLDAAIAKMDMEAREYSAQARTKKAQVGDETKKMTDLQGKADGVLATGYDVRVSLEQERYVGKLLDEITQIELHKKQAEAELNRLRQERLKVQQDLVNYSPDAVKAARTRLLSPGASKTHLGGEIGQRVGFGRMMFGMEEQIQDAQFSGEEQRRLEKEQKEKERQSKRDEKDADSVFRDAQRGGGGSVDFSGVTEGDKNVTAALHDLLRAVKSKNMDQVGVIREITREVEQQKNHNKYSGRPR